MPHNMSPSINAVIARAASSSSADKHYQVLHALLPETSLHSTCTFVNKCFTKWLCDWASLVLTERIRDPTLVMITFSARSATMMFKSEGVMHTLVSTAQNHAFLPAWNRAQKAAATANSQMQRQRAMLQQQRWSRLGLFIFFRPPGGGWFWDLLPAASGM